MINNHMKTKFIYNINYYSYIIIYVVFFSYIILYAFLLKEISIYYTYMMFFLTGLMLGYMIADKAHKYLKKVKN